MEQPSRLSLYFGSIGNPEDYDPAHIEFQAQYAFMMAVYSTLTETNEHGQVVSGWAKSFGWEGNTAVFEMREDAVASDGLPLTAQDAAFSLKRLLVLASNTHGDLKSVLCSSEELRSINQPCDDIEVKGNVLRLRLKKRYYFLFSMLSSVDYAIIPERAVDPSTLKIKNFNISSGPYSVREFKPETVFLQVNKSHWHYSINMPQQIDLLSFQGSGGLELSNIEIVEFFKKGKFDAISTHVIADQSSLINLASKSKEIDLHVSQAICLLVLQFLPNSERLTQDLKHQIGALVRRAFAKKYEGNNYGRVSTEEFFVPLGEGGLSPSQKAELADIAAKYESLDSMDASDLVIQVTKGSGKRATDILSPFLKGVKIVEGRNGFSPKNDTGLVPDMVLFGTDSSGIEDITLLSYSLASGLLPYPMAENKAWLQRYTFIEDKDQRLQLLRQLHFDMLTKPTVVPISAMPYFAAARKPWKLNFSELFAGGELWRIERQN